MAQLYTVKMVAKSIKSLFDACGTKIGEITKLIPQTYSDLPHSTAQNYRRQFPDNQVQIIPQHGEFGGEGRIGTPHGESRSGHKGAAEYSKGPKSWDSDANRKLAKKQVEDAQQRAAQTGDMAAAINAELNR